MSVHAALLTANARWNIAAATVTSAVALAAFASMLTRVRRTTHDGVTRTEVDHEAGAPVRRAGRTQDHG
jgi:hypothetical protein